LGNRLPIGVCERRHYLFLAGEWLPRVAGWIAISNGFTTPGIGFQIEAVKGDSFN